MSGGSGENSVIKRSHRSRPPAPPRGGPLATTPLNAWSAHPHGPRYVFPQGLARPLRHTVGARHPAGREARLPGRPYPPSAGGRRRRTTLGYAVRSSGRSGTVERTVTVSPSRVACQAMAAACAAGQSASGQAMASTACPAVNAVALGEAEWTGDPTVPPWERGLWSCEPFAVFQGDTRAVLPVAEHWPDRA